MRGLAVVALQAVVAEDLPVEGHAAAARLIAGCLHGVIAPRPQPLDPGQVGQDIGEHVACLLGQGGGRGIEVDEDHAELDLDPHGAEGEIGLVEALDVLAVARAAQGAIQAIGPGMVGAGDDRLEVAAAAQQLVGPVAADVVKAAQHAVAPAHHGDGLVDDRHGDVVAGLLQVGDMAGILPAAVEDALLLGIEHRGIAVVAAIQGERLFGIGRNRALVPRVQTHRLGHRRLPCHSCCSDGRLSRSGGLPRN